jgi:cardiolipin synthase
VLGLHAIFLEDWLAATGETDDLHADDPRIETTILAELSTARPTRSSGPMVQIIPSGPDLPPGLGIAAQFVAAISTASERCWIATPYFVPDDALNLALKIRRAARRRRPRCSSRCPRNNDSRLVSLAARSYYDECLEAGCADLRVPARHAARQVHPRRPHPRRDRLRQHGRAQLPHQLRGHRHAVRPRRRRPARRGVQRGHLSRALEVRSESRRHLSLYARLGEAFARMLSPLL